MTGWDKVIANFVVFGLLMFSMLLFANTYHYVDYLNKWINSLKEENDEIKEKYEQLIEEKETLDCEIDYFKGEIVHITEQIMKNRRDQMKFDAMPFCIDRVFEILELKIVISDPEYRSAVEVKCKCPFHTENGTASFSFNRRSGTWKCDMCSETNKPENGIFDLIEKVHGKGEVFDRIIEKMQNEGLLTSKT